MSVKCTGLKFRSRTSNFFNKKTMSFEHKESLTLLKRESCKCEECIHAVKDIQNDAGYDLIDCVHWRGFSGTEDEELEDMATYKAKPKWENHDEGLEAYVVELDFYKVKN